MSLPSHRSPPECTINRGFPVDKFSRWETAATYYAFGLHWGNPQAQNAKGHILGHIKVRALRVHSARDPFSITMPRRA